MVCDYCTIVSYTSGSSSKTEISSSLNCTCENSLPITKDIGTLRSIQASDDLEFKVRAETSNSIKCIVSLGNNEADKEIRIKKTKEAVNEFGTMLSRIHGKAELTKVFCSNESLTSANVAVQTDLPYIGLEVAYGSLAERCGRLEVMMKTIKKKLFRSRGRNVGTLNIRLTAPVKSEPVEYVDSESESGSEPVQHMMESGSEPVQQMMESGSEPVQHMMESGSEPVQQMMESGSEPVQHMMESGSEPVQQMMDSEHATQVESQSEPVALAMEWESESESVEHVESESGSESESEMVSEHVESESESGLASEYDESESGSESETVEFMVDSESQSESEPEAFAFWGSESVTHVASEPVVHITDSDSEYDSDSEPFAYSESESEPSVHVASEPSVLVTSEPIVHIIDSESDSEPEPVSYPRSELESVVYSRSELEPKSVPELEPTTNETSEAQLICVICINERINTVLNCGHTLCRKCSRLIQICHVCRCPIDTRQHVFI